MNLPYKSVFTYHQDGKVGEVTAVAMDRHSAGAVVSERAASSDEAALISPISTRGCYSEFNSNKIFGAT